MPNETRQIKLTSLLKELEANVNAAIDVFNTGKAGTARTVQDWRANMALVYAACPDVTLTGEDAVRAFVEAVGAKFTERMRLDPLARLRRLGRIHWTPVGWKVGKGPTICVNCKQPSPSAICPACREKAKR